MPSSLFNVVICFLFLLNQPPADLELWRIPIVAVAVTVLSPMTVMIMYVHVHTYIHTQNIEAQC